MGFFRSQLASLMDWDLMDANTPALVVLETLASRGWALGAPPAAHTLQTARQYKCPHALRWKPYLQCLCVLEQLCGPGALEALRSDQVVEYDQCILQAKSKQAVPLWGDAKMYKQLMDAGAGHDPAPCITDKGLWEDDVPLQLLQAVT